jgi:polyisoprenoid-binding protein YceI
VAFVASMNGQAINGSFRRFDARIAFDPADLAGSSVMAVIDTGSALTGDQTRDEALPSADWLTVKLFPRATFSAKTFKSLGGDAIRQSARSTLGATTIRCHAIPSRNQGFSRTDARQRNDRPPLVRCGSGSVRDG